MLQTDTRLVQTAVIGGRDSEVPVILPEEPHNLDEFRRQFGTNRFWCGTLLGGCGEKLMTKRYETKVCHFSHYPDRDGNRTECHRSATGEDSADHLFIRLHVKEWLAGQGHAAQCDLRSLGHGPGDAVDFWLRATGQHLRFVLRPQDYHSWRRAADSLGAREGHVDWVFRSEGAVTQEMTARQGYALRVRCETAGADRRVLVGTVAEGGQVSWEPLEQCRMTRDGLVTPALEALRAGGRVRQGGMRNHPLPAVLPLHGARVVFAVDPTAKRPADAELSAEGRYLVPGFVKPDGSRIIRALLSLPDEVPVPTDQYVYLLSGRVGLLITDPLPAGTPSWAVRADNLTQLQGLYAERTGLWRPSVALMEEAAPAPQVLQSSGPESRPSAPERGPAAAMLRRELERVAAENTTTTWSELSSRIDLDLAHLPDPARRELLVEVDRPLEPGSPLLSVLVLAPSGRVLPYLGTVLRRLGASAPASDTALQRWSAAEIERTQDAYGRPSDPPPTSTPTLPIPAFWGNPATADPASPPDVRAASKQFGELRQKLREAVALAPKAGPRRAERLTKAIRQARTHLAGYKAAHLHGQDLRSWTRASHQIRDELARLIGHPVTPSQLAAATRTGAIAKAGPKARSPKPGDAPRTLPLPDAPKPRSTEEIDAIASRFEQARRAGNLAEALLLQQQTGRVGEQQLTAEDTQRVRQLSTAMATWIRPRASEAAQIALRALLEDLARPKPSDDPLQLRSGLARARILRRHCGGSLPEDVQVLFDTLQAKSSRTTTSPGSGEAPAHGERTSAHTEALEQFEWLRDEIRAAQSADDLSAVQTARQLAGPLYARELSATDREKYAPFMREVKAWCGERKQVDPTLRRIRELLAELAGHRKDGSADEVRLTLGEITRLRGNLTKGLSQSEAAAVDRWHSRLRHQERSGPKPGLRPRTPRGRTERPAVLRQTDRLPPEAVDRLAAAARKVLTDTARSGGKVLTWGDLRIRMGGALPHLHPDDQGELLVAVDRETPAGDPLLSTLIASTDASLHWIYRHVRFSLGRERIPDAELEAHWATEVLRLRQRWRHQ
ncbi:hypothetical protein ACWC5I_26765 [Kitasatospora sp. NPDC001574]